MDVKEAKRKCEWFIASDMFYGHVLHTAMSVVLSELEKKDLIINEMAEYMNLLSNELIAETGINDLKFCNLEACTNNPEIECKDCIKEYFTKKVEGK